MVASWFVVRRAFTEWIRKESAAVNAGTYSVNAN